MAKPKAVDVYDKAGAFVRTYSEAEHGKGFISLAEGFAKKIGGRVEKNQKAGETEDAE
jgi:hypothetical protein